MSFVPIETNSFLTWTSRVAEWKFYVLLTLLNFATPNSNVSNVLLALPKEPSIKTSSKGVPSHEHYSFFACDWRIPLMLNTQKRGILRRRHFLNDMLQHSLTSFGASVWCPFTTPCLIMAWDPGFITFIVLCSLGSSRSARLSGLPQVNIIHLGKHYTFIFYSLLR